MYRFIISALFALLSALTSATEICDFEPEQVNDPDAPSNLFNFAFNISVFASELETRSETIRDISTTTPQLTAEINAELTAVREKMAKFKQLTQVYSKFVEGIDVPVEMRGDKAFETNFMQSKACLARIQHNMIPSIESINKSYSLMWRKANANIVRPLADSAILSDYLFPSVTVTNKCSIMQSKWNELSKDNVLLVEQSYFSKAHYSISVEQDSDPQTGDFIYRNVLVLAIELPSVIDRYQSDFQSYKQIDNCGANLSPLYLEELITENGVEILGNVDVEYRTCIEATKYQCGLRTKGHKIYRKYCTARALELSLLKIRPQIKLAHIRSTLFNENPDIVVERKNVDLNHPYLGTTTTETIFENKVVIEAIEEKLGDKLAEHLNFRARKLKIYKNAMSKDALIFMEFASKPLRSSEICKVNEEIKNIKL